MGATTIEWTGPQLPNGDWVPGYTFNPWWGCQKVSEGCKNCYAEGLDHRYHGGAHWGPLSTRKAQTEKYWKQPYNWNKKAFEMKARLKVFCASMADIFEDMDALREWRFRAFETMFCTPHLDWLLLTKRPENILPMVNDWLRSKKIKSLPDNIWLGATTSRVLAMGGLNVPKPYRSTIAQYRIKVKLITFNPPIANTLLAEVAG